MNWNTCASTANLMSPSATETSTDTGLGAKKRKVPSENSRNRGCKINWPRLLESAPQLTGPSHTPLRLAPPLPRGQTQKPPVRATVGRRPRPGRRRVDWGFRSTGTATGSTETDRNGPKRTSGDRGGGRLYAPRRMTRTQETWMISLHQRMSYFSTIKQVDFHFHVSQRGLGC